MHVGGKEEVSADFRDQVPFRFCLIHGRRPNRALRTACCARSVRGGPLFRRLKDHAAKCRSPDRQHARKRKSLATHCRKRTDSLLVTLDR